MGIFRALARNPPRRLLGWPGRCTVCEAKGGSGRTVYVEKGPWARDDLLCLRCRSKPRERSLMRVLGEVRPHWRQLQIHESSPGHGGASVALQVAPGYSSSQYLDGVARGANSGSIRCEDLRQLTFPDMTFDVIVTQDVLEHVLHPDRVLDEVWRVLRPGGIHIATFPWYPHLASTRVRARLNDAGELEYLEPADYHRSPVNGGASLVTLDWGADLFTTAEQHGYDLAVHKLWQARRHGIDGEFREVFVFERPATSTSDRH